MAMSIPLPTRQILALFQQNNTEALSLVAASGCCSRMQPGMDYDKEADALYVNFQRPARDAWVSARSGRSAPDASSNPSGLRPAPDPGAARAIVRHGEWTRSARSTHLTARIAPPVPLSSGNVCNSWPSGSPRRVRSWWSFAKKRQARTGSSSPRSSHGS
jgi:hypothetical protein